MVDSFLQGAEKPLKLRAPPGYGPHHPVAVIILLAILFIAHVVVVYLFQDLPLLFSRHFLSFYVQLSKKKSRKKCEHKLLLSC